ncbi:MAG: SPOR domain-containing protein, partial [Deltaproteobacteria bacterium]|nr:SPOR domain-containing protein [Deltaproteobacteria bacterium]
LVGLSWRLAAVRCIVVGMVWAFILGVLVGKGYKPENVVPEIARLMPESQVVQKAEEPGVLKAEELEYFDALKRAKPVPAEEHAKPRSESKPEPKPEPKTPPKASPSDPVQTHAVVPSKPERNEAIAPPARQKASADQDGGDEDSTVYQYIYQVASFKDRPSAQTFIRKLDALGVRSSISETTIDGRPWFRVLAYFRGTPKDTREFKSKLASLGVTKALMKSKIPL